MMTNYINVFTFLRDKHAEEPKLFFNVHEIMEALEIASEDILSVKNILESGIDAGDYERKINKGKAHYRLKDMTSSVVIG